MYKKLFKNFAVKNLKTFLFIFISISLSLFWYIFSDSLSKNFLNIIENDTRENLWWDFVIDIWNKDESTLKDFFEEFPYKEETQITKEFSITSSIETPDIIPANIVFISDNFPFYSNFKFDTIDKNWDLLLSKDLYNSLDNKKTIKLLWTTYKIKWIFSESPSSISWFLWVENIFINFNRLKDSIADEKNSLIDKKFFIKLNEQKLFTEINNYLKDNENLKWVRVRNYKDWWERFEDIIKNLRWYINYAVLFSFLLTTTIIFLAISSFFIKERKEISIIRILWMKDTQFLKFYMFVFFTLLLASFLLSFILAKLWFYFLQDIEVTKWFVLYSDSIIKWFLIWFILLWFSLALPITKLLKSEPNSWLENDFYANFTKREFLYTTIIFSILCIVLSFILWYWALTSFIIPIILLICIFLFYIFSRYLLKFIFSKSNFLRKKHFFLYDPIRFTTKPWNLSILLNLSFFIVFSIWFFILILFWNFYDRLQINLETDKNLFIVNIDDNTYKKLDDNYKKESFSLLKWRMIKINWTELKEHFKDKPSRRFSREFNITDNSLDNLGILSGKELEIWWVSIDNNFLKDLEVGIWDKITFLIYWIEKELEIINIRESEDYSINPFFYFQVSPEEFKEFPKLYFLSTYAEKEEINQIKKYFYDLSSWTVSFVEVDKILEEIKEISKKVILVIESLFAYIAIFCLLTIWVVWLFFNQFQKQTSLLYKFIWTTTKQNKLRMFFEYFYLWTLMFIVSVLIISSVSYYILSKNDFISFWTEIYFISLWAVFVTYIIILFWMWFFIKE